MTARVFLQSPFFFPAPLLGLTFGRKRLGCLFPLPSIRIPILDASFPSPTQQLPGSIACGSFGRLGMISRHPSFHECNTLFVVGDDAAQVVADCGHAFGHQLDLMPHVFN